MNTDAYIALAIFSFASSITPGPNNLMLMASGANYGIRRSLPHMMGVGIGFVFMVLMVGIGLVQIFESVSWSYLALKIISAVYLLYLAGRIATAAAPGEGEAESGKPFTFWQAAAFQWVNPKAWTMALTAVAVYAPSQSLLAGGLVAAAFGSINLPCISLWTAMGEQLRVVLTNPRRLRAFNITMALLLVASLYPVLI